MLYPSLSRRCWLALALLSVTACDAADKEVAVLLQSTRIAVGGSRLVSVDDACRPTQTDGLVEVCSANCSCGDEQAEDATFQPSNLRLDVDRSSPTEAWLIGTRPGLVEVDVEAQFDDGTVRQQRVIVEVVDPDRLMVGGEQTCVLDNSEGALHVGVLANAPFCLRTELAVEGDLLGIPDVLSLVADDDNTVVEFDLAPCDLDVEQTVLPVGDYTVVDTNGMPLVWESASASPVDIHIQSFSPEAAGDSNHRCLHRLLEDEGLFDFIGDLAP